MNKSNCITLSLCLITMCVSTICRSQPKLNTLTVSCSDTVRQVSFGLFNPLTGGLQPIAQLNLKGASPVKSSFTLKSPQFAFFRFGNEIHTLYLRPGEQLHLQLDKIDKQTIITFSGQGSEANSYLAKTRLIQQQFEKGVFALPLSTAFQRLDSLDNAVRLLDLTYLQKNRIPPTVLTILRQQCHIRVLSLKLNMLLAKYSGGQDTTVVAQMLQIAQLVPFEPTLLAAHHPDYLYLLYLYRTVRLMLHLANTFTKEQMAAIDPQLPIVTDETIKKWPISSTFIEYMRAANLNIWIATQGITTETTSVLNTYRKWGTSTVYLDELQKSYDKWLLIRKGRKAPDFTGLTPDGKSLSLSQLKGKVVYIDVWATWCSPCRAEFPFAKKIQQKFLLNNEVAFLYISIDKNQTAWKKLASTEEVPSGYHINITSDDFMKSYIVKGVPRYILIDKKGNIANPEAPRPSSNDIEKAIEVLLK